MARERQPWVPNLRRLEVECRPGKYYVSEAGRDKWGRPVIVFNNTVQNTTEVGPQMEALIFTLLRAIRQLPSGVEKYAPP